jgi:hypothetical protein
VINPKAVWVIWSAAERAFGVIAAKIEKSKGTMDGIDVMDGMDIVDVLMSFQPGLYLSRSPG